jgi:hypothetical protein
VLLVGGISLDLTQFLLTLNPLDLIFSTRSDCQVYTPAFSSFGTFATVNGMQIGRAAPAVAPLPNGGALIAGGFELAINPTTQTFGFTPHGDRRSVQLEPERDHADGLDVGRAPVPAVGESARRHGHGARRRRAGRDLPAVGTRACHCCPRRGKCLWRNAQPQEWQTWRRSR